MSHYHRSRETCWLCSTEQEFADLKAQHDADANADAQRFAKQPPRELYPDYDHDEAAFLAEQRAEPETALRGEMPAL